MTLQFGLAITTVVLKSVDNHGRGLLSVNDGIDVHSAEFLHILAKNPYFLTPDAFKATADFLKTQYGSGEESDSDDSVYSISEVTGGMSL